MRWLLPCVAGESATDCGPAALATVARYYRKRVSVLRLNDELRTGVHGTDIETLRQGAEGLGFEAAIGNLQREAIAKVALPLIAHVRRDGRGHFVVVYSVNARRVTLADPAEGILTVSRTEYEEMWTGRVLLVRPARGFRSDGWTWAPLLQLVAIARRDRSLLLPAAWLALALALGGYAMSSFVKTIVDRVIPGSDLSLLNLVIFEMTVLVGMRAIFGAVRQLILAAVGKRIAVSLGVGFMAQALALPVRFHDAHHGGEMLTRFLDVPKVAGVITGPLLTVVFDTVFILVCALVMFAYSAQLTLLTLAVLPLFAIAALLAIGPIRKRERLYRERFSKLAGLFVDTIDGIRLIKSYTDESGALRRLSEAYEAVQQSVISRAKLATVSSSVSGLLAGAAIITLLGLGARLAVQKTITIGDLILFYAVLGMCLSAVDRLVPTLPALAEALMGLERVQDLNLVPSEHNGALFRFPADHKSTELEFRDVSFSYRASTPVLTGVSFTATRGETVVILGETGSGKSSLVSLIPALYEATTGQVLLNGRDVRDLDKVVLRRHVSLVMQDARLIGGTIGENIAMGMPEATAQDIEAAARIAAAHDFVMEFPDGYSHRLGPSGIGLSGGQRQRIALARAVLRKPAVLILDEASSNLDPKTELQIINALREDNKDRITVVATHRIVSAADADLVIVLDHGVIVERGTHKELLKLGGKYEQLWSISQGGDGRLQEARGSHHRVVL